MTPRAEVGSNAYFEIYGDRVLCRVLHWHPFGTVDVERLSDGECFRVSGLPVDGPPRAGASAAVQAAQSFVLLSTLPPGHRLRTAPLASIAAECRNKQCKDWRPVLPRWAIAQCSYDALGEAWTATTEFRVAVDC